MAFSIEVVSRLWVKHAYPIDARRGGKFSEIEERRHQVVQADQTIARRVCGNAPPLFGIDDDERNTRGGVIHQPFAVKTMIAKHFAVIGGEYDDCVVENPLFPKRAEQQPQLMIDMGAQGVKGALGIL